MRITDLAGMLALATVLTPSPILADKPAGTARRTFTFDDGNAGTSPAGWAVTADPSAPSGKNYYVTRANALEGNVCLYYVNGGRREQIASWRGKVAAGAWHDYAVEFRGDHIQVTWDGAKVLDHRDRTFPKPGKVGLWTKADSVTYFDDLAAEPL